MNLSGIGRNRNSIRHGLQVFRGFVSRVHVTDNWIPILKATDKISRRAMVICDVDNTLIRPTSVIANEASSSRIRKLWEAISNEYMNASGKGPQTFTNGHESGPASQEKWKEDYYRSLMYQQVQHEVIDPLSSYLIDKLNTNRIPTIALTALRAGTFGSIPDVLDWRINGLKQLGYHFGRAQINPSFYIANIDNYVGTAYKEGVLFSSNYSKGAILKAFLESDEVNFLPTEIIFVDDKMEHVDSVTDAMDEIGIGTTSFHYTGQKHMSGAEFNVMTEVQMRHLIYHEKLLTDEQTRQLISSDRRV